MRLMFSLWLLLMVILALQLINERHGVRQSGHDDFEIFFGTFRTARQINDESVAANASSWSG